MLPDKLSPFLSADQVARHIKPGSKSKKIEVYL